MNSKFLQSSGGLLTIVALITLSFQGIYTIVNSPKVDNPTEISATAAGNPFLGEIQQFAGNFAPRGWMFCEGQLLSIDQNQALFSILGTNYGGDGRTSFALPDLRGRVPLHPGTGPGLSSYSLGQQVGAENHTLTLTQMPSHRHAVTLRGSTKSGEDVLPSGLYPAVTQSNAYHRTDDTNMGAPDVASEGGNQPFGIRQPSIAINFIIAVQGTFPSRN